MDFLSKWTYLLVLVNHIINSDGISAYTGRLPDRPNIVLLITDDQDVELGSMQYMPRTLRILKDKGVEFTHGFVTTPICCPSRTSILTGMYVHNHHVQSNNKNCTGREWRELHEKRTFNHYLHENGYETGYFGKYLNEYNGDYIPPGWDTWNGLIKNSRFYNYTLNVNGEHQYHGSDYVKDYLTDLVANDSIAFIQMFNDVKTHRTPSWNYAPNPDKTWLLERTGKMQPIHVFFTDMLQQRRLQTLQSVDMAIQRVVNELRDLNALSNTYILYTSDHGYHLGQYGLIKGKNLPYEFDIKVPYFMRGPGLEKGVSVRAPVANIDLAPTILDIAGIPTPDHMDGRSVLPLVLTKQNETEPWRDTLLIERGKMPQLDRLRERLSRQRSRFDKALRINNECSKEEYSAPCRLNQRWQCMKNEEGRWRIIKCRATITVEANCDCHSQLRYKRQTASHHIDDGHIVLSMKKLQQLAVNTRTNYGLPRRTLVKWEEEFFNQLLQQEIVEDNGWHQGIFDAVESSDHVLFETGSHEAQIFNGKATQSVGQNTVGQKKQSDDWTSRRRKRSTPRERRRDRKDRRRMLADDPATTVNCADGQCSADGSDFADGFEDRPSNNEANELTLKAKVRALKQRLRQTRNMRKRVKSQVNNEMADGSVETSEEMNAAAEETCECQLDANEHQPHPLRSPTQPTISKAIWTDSELLVIKDVVASSRRQHRHRQRKPKPSGRGRKADKRLAKFYCNIPRMNCFTHDANHWRTPPLWPEELGGFCFCQNSNNNTYWCLRTVNDTHNFLYCEFVTGFVSYYDINNDPYQLRNAVYELTIDTLDSLSSQLASLRTCKGNLDCELHSRSTTYDNRDFNYDTTYGR